LSEVAATALAPAQAAVALARPTTRFTIQDAIRNRAPLLDGDCMRPEIEADVPERSMVPDR
jgi:hypothetical protein